MLRISVVLALLVSGLAGTASSQTPDPRDSGAALRRDLQAELASLSAQVRMLGAGLPTSAAPLDALNAALDRIRATDLLIAARDRQIEERLRNEGASSAVQQRHRDNARLVREGLDRVYTAATPLPELQDTAALGPTAIRSLLEALAVALPSALADADRPLLGATLPHRVLSLPQVAPRFDSSITPAYLDAGPVAPAAADSAATSDAAFAPLIRARASELARDPIDIFEFVQNEIDTEFYYGSMKGGEETLRQTSGNDTDQASLLIALLRASGVPARYVRGVVELTGAQAVAWTGVGTARRAAEVFTRAGIPFRPVVQGGSIGAFEVEHTWVEAYVPYSNYRGARLGSTGQAWIPLDPSFKTLDVSLGEDILAAMGFTADTLVGDYLSLPQAQSPVDFYQARIDDYLAASRSDLTIDQALATLTTRPLRTGLLPSTLPYNVLSVNEELADVPERLKHRVRFKAEGEGGVSFDVTLSAAALAGRRLTLSYVPARVEDQDVVNSFLGLHNTPAYLVRVRPVLKVSGVVEAAGATSIQMGALHSFTVEIQSPRETVPLVNPIMAGGYYAIGLASGNSLYEIPPVRAAADTEHPAADRLYDLAADYHQRWHDAEQTLRRILRVVDVRPMLAHVMVGNAYTRTLLFGQPQDVDWRGVFVDADLHVSEPVPIGADNARAREFMRLSGLAGSMLEGEVLQQNLQVDAVSAARLIQLAREQLVPIEEVDATNVASVLPQLQTADIVKAEIADAVNQGWRVTIPRRDLVRHAWSGIGYIALDPVTGAGGYFISGGFAGGDTTQSPEEWAEGVAEQLGTPYQDDPNPDPTSAYSIVKVLPTDGQKGTAGMTLPQNIAVWVRDAEGKPVENAVVTFRIVAGGGRFANQDTVTVQTNHSGIAEANPELGRRTADAPFYVKADPGDFYDTQVGENLVTASVQANGGQIPLDAPFQLFGLPGPPTQIVKVLGDQNLAIVGTAAGTIRARVLDSNENPISNLPLLFTVLPAVPRLGPLPPAAINLQLYFKEVCAVPVPLLDDCGDLNQASVVTSMWGASIETILGNTADTRFRVEVKTEDLSAEPGEQILSTEFGLVSAGSRDYRAPFYAGPILSATLLELVNDRGQLLNAAKVGTELPRPLEVVIAVVQDDYRVEPTGSPCPTAPEEPDCFRLVGLQTTRVRPIDIGAPGMLDEVTFPGPSGSILGRPRADESVRIEFAVHGGGATSPLIVELPEHGLGRGRYQSRVTVGPEPALNRVLIDPTAYVWVPAFNLRDTAPVVPFIARLRPGLTVTSVDPTTSPPTYTIGPAEFYPTDLEHDVFGVRARVLNDEHVLLGETGAARADVDIEYVIEPMEYDADLAELDVLDGPETSPGGAWMGFVPATSTSGEGHGRIHRGTGGFSEGSPFDATRDYSVQVVLNRGGDAEIKGDKQTLGVLLTGPLGVDFRARENTAQESRRKAAPRLDEGLRKEKENLTKLIKTGLANGAACRVPIEQIAILEQGSGACFWSARFNFGDPYATPARPPDPVGACSGFQPGISDHDYEVIIPDSFHTGPDGPAACLVDALNDAAEDPELNLGAVSFFRVSKEEMVAGKLNIDPPPSGGSDAVGDVGLGRQTLLFKWALEGEWVTELVSQIGGLQIEGLHAPEVSVGGQDVPLLVHVINALRTTGTIEGEKTGIPRLEGLEWGVLQHFNFYKAGAHVGITGKSADPKSHLYALRQKAIHDAAKAGIRAATGRLLANPFGNALFLDTSRARYRGEGGCLTGAENPSNPPPPTELFPKSCDSFEEHIASTAILDFLSATAETPSIFNAADIARIYQFYRIKEDVECAARGCQTEITSEEDANLFVKGVLEFIRDSVVSNPEVLAAYKTVLNQPGSEVEKRESNRAKADAGRAEATDTVSYVLEARVFNDNALELHNVPVNMYTPSAPLPVPVVSYSVPRILGRTSPPTGPGHDPRWTDTIVDVRRDFLGVPIPDPEDGKPQPVFEWEIDATGQHPAWFVLDPLNRVRECNKSDNRSGFIAYRIDMNNPGSIPDATGMPGPPVTDPAIPAECVSEVPSLQVTKLVNNQAEITVAARTPVTVRNVITNTGAVPLQGVQVVDFLLNRTYPPFPLAPGQSMPLEGEFESAETGKQFIGPTEVLAFVPDTIIPGGKTIGAWDSVRVNVVAPSCSIVVAPPTPDPNRYDTDGQPVSTVMQGGNVYRYYKAYGAPAESMVEVMVDEEPLQAFVDRNENVAHYEPDPRSTTGGVRLVPGLEIPHTLIGVRGTYDVRFVSVGGTRSVCSEPFDVVVTPREFTRVFSAGASIDAAATAAVGLAGKAGAGLDIKITEQPGPVRTKLAIARSVNGKLGVQAGISSPKAKIVLPGFRGQVGASAQATLAGLVMAGDTHEFAYQPNSTQLEQQDAAALGALILGQVASGTVPIVGKLLEVLINQAADLDQYKTTDTVSLGIDGSAGAQAGAVGGLGTFKKEDNSSLGTLQYGLGAEGSAQLGGSALVSVDSKLLAEELIPGFKLNLSVGFDVTGGIGNLSESEPPDPQTEEKVLELEKVLTASLNGSFARSAGAKLTLDTAAGFAPKTLTFSAATDKKFGWQVAGLEYTIIDNPTPGKETFTYTFDDPDVLQEVINQLDSINQLTAVGLGAGLSLGAGPVLGPALMVVELMRLKAIVADRDGSYEATTEVGHPTEIPVEIDLGAGARVKAAANIKFDRAINFHTVKGVIKHGNPYALEKYTDDDFIPDLQDLGDITDLFSVSFGGLLAEVGPVIDVVQQAVVALLNVVQSNNTAQLTFDGATAPFPQIGIASFTFEPLPGPVAPALQLPADITGPADSPHYGIGGFHQFLPENQQLTAPGTLKIFYDDAEVAGFDERTLAVYEWNETAGDWDHLGGTVDPIANTVTTSVRRMALYTAAPPMPGSRFSFSVQSATAGTANDPMTLVTATSGTIRMNTGVVVPDGTLFTVRTLVPQGTDLTPFGTVTSADEDPLLDGIQVRSLNGVVRFTAELPGAVGAVKFLTHAVRGTAQADQVVTY